MRPRRNVVVVLSAEEWDRLVASARSVERDPFVHARALLRRGLDADVPCPEMGDDDDGVLPRPTADVA